MNIVLVLKDGALYIRRLRSSHQGVYWCVPECYLGGELIVGVNLVFVLKDGALYIHRLRSSDQGGILVCFRELPWWLAYCWGEHGFSSQRWSTIHSQTKKLSNKKFLDYLKEIYPSQLTVEKANKSDHLADYLDLTFIIDSGGKLSTRLYDKRDDFDFHIVNFPFLSSNIPSGPSYGVYISQLIRYARCCSHYDDFRYRHKCLVDRLLSQGYKALRLEKSFKKFYGRYQDLIEKYRRSVNAMVSDSFPGQFLFNM